MVLLPFLYFISKVCNGGFGFKGSFLTTGRLNTIGRVKRLLERPAVLKSQLPNFIDSSPELAAIETYNLTSNDEVLSKLLQQIQSLRKLVLHQQQQLDQLQEEVKKVSLPSAILFIDGTWLYYSLYERSTVAHRLNNPYWRFSYDVDWKKVLALLCREFDVNIKEQYVYTSAKADTGTMSTRLTLFENLRTAGFNVDMQETIGSGEKCVDIKLATQMIAQDYDIGLILTGDKDFLPALTLCRQKQGKKIGLVSMREACNRALSDLYNVRDFDVFWLEDHIHEIMIPKETSLGQNLDMPQLSPADHEDLDFIYCKVIYDMIVDSGVSFVHARDLGRHLKKIPLLQTTILDFIKSFCAGVSQYISSNKAFVVKNNSDQPNHWVVSWAVDVPPPKYESASKTPSKVMKDFQEVYTEKFREIITKNKQVVYEHTYRHLRAEGANKVFDDSMKKDELQQACVDRGLSKWGTKAELIARLTEPQAAPSHEVEGVDFPEESHLQELLVSFLESQGGQARSRHVGRHLASCDPYDDFHSNALSELKALFGTLFEFVTRSDGLFEVTPIADDTEFMIIRNGSRIGTLSQPSNAGADTADSAFHHLKDLLTVFLRENGGRGSSREIGRFLVSNRAYNSTYRDASSELKASYGNLGSFISQAEDYFTNNGVIRGNEFEVGLVTESASVAP